MPHRKPETTLRVKINPEGLLSSYVIAVIGIVTALILPAVQAARESARKTECMNNLKQIATAVHLHHDIQRHFPTNGWGWQWVGAADRGFDEKQPGGWCFNVLPFLEQESARELATGSISTGALLQTPVEVFYCPSRRNAKTYPFDSTLPQFHNSASVLTAAKTDYAICAGDRIIHTPPGPPSTNPSDLRNYAWPPFRSATGISYVLSRTRMVDITDGNSNTAMIGEKYIARQHYTSGQSLGDDQTAYLGDDADIRRWTNEPPFRDGGLDDIQNFGSAHTAGCYFAICDGSVRQIAYTIDAQVFRNFGNRHDGNPTTLDE